MIPYQSSAAKNVGYLALTNKHPQLSGGILLAFAALDLLFDHLAELTYLIVVQMVQFEKLLRVFPKPRKFSNLNSVVSYLHVSDQSRI